MATFYFAYGADMDAAELDLHHDRKRRPRLRFARWNPAVLKGYRLVCDIASSYRKAGIFNVVPDPGSSVYGVLYELSPGDTISVTTLKEGDKARYELSLLPIETLRGLNATALVLHAVPDKKTLAPSDAYVDIVARAARHHGLPAEWVRRLEGMKASPAK